MIDLGLSQTTEAWMVLGTVVLMFALFMRETYPAEVTALGGVALLMIFGLLPIAEAQSVLSNSAPWTIAAMFLVMGGLVRTGALNWLTRQAENSVASAPARTVILLLFFGVANNRAAEFSLDLRFFLAAGHICRDRRFDLRMEAHAELVEPEGLYWVIGDDLLAGYGEAGFSDDFRDIACIHRTEELS